MRRGLLLLAGLVLLGGCGADVAGDAAPDQRHVGPLLPDAVFGDLTTIDPCGYLEPSAFAEYGEVDAEPTPDFDTCTYVVNVPQAQVLVAVGELVARADLPEGTEEKRALPREATLLAPPSDDNGCHRAVALRGGQTVSVRANSSGAADKGQPYLCELAEAGADAMFDTMVAGKVRHWSPPADSLATVSACGLLDDEFAATQLGIGPGKVVSYPSEHQCRWGRTGGDTATALVRFLANERESVVRPGSLVEQIDQRTTWVLPQSATNTAICTLATEHVESALAGDGWHEYVVLSVLVPRAAGKDACTVGRELAIVAWPKLPD